MIWKPKKINFVERRKPEFAFPVSLEAPVQSIDSIAYVGPTHCHLSSYVLGRVYLTSALKNKKTNLTSQIKPSPTKLGLQEQL